MAERGSLDLLGPSTKRARTAVLAGTPPAEAGRHGDTNGAAMRITPVGIAFAATAPPAAEDRLPRHPVGSPHAGALDADAGGRDTGGRRDEGSRRSARPAGSPHAGAPDADAGDHPEGVAHDAGRVADGLPGLVDRVVEASLVTHNTSVALAGAGAVAAAVSAGVGGASVVGATKAGIAAARLAATRGHWVAGADVAARINWATDLTEGAEPDRAAELIGTLVGTSLATQESVPAAFAVLSAVPGDPWRACLLAASLGGDTDTIAAMAGAIAGACHGQSAFPPHAIAAIDAHGFALPALADALLALREVW
jgi:ADP-ribosylglycohydrolase